MLAREIEDELQNAGKPRKLKIRYPYFVALTLSFLALFALIIKMKLHPQEPMTEFNFLCTLLVFALGFGFFVLRRERDVLIWGDMVMGVIVADRIYPYRRLVVSYEYQDQHFESTSFCLERRDRVFGGRYAPGERVAILVHPANPKRCVVYSAASYKVIV